jgi:hypothetical protein
MNNKQTLSFQNHLQEKLMVDMDTDHHHQKKLMDTDTDILHQKKLMDTDTDILMVQAINAAVIIERTQRVTKIFR